MSVFDADIFTYHYPNSSDQSSEDLKQHFAQDSFGRYKVVDTLAHFDSFIHLTALNDFQSKTYDFQTI